jgi:hypothetical protein
MTTWEAAELETWLVRVQSGLVAPTPFDGSDKERLLTFTEPCLGFSLTGRDATSARVRSTCRLKHGRRGPMKASTCSTIAS